MWFKNLLVYRFTRPFTTELDALEEQLTAAAFTPCSGTQPSSIGCSKPLGDAGELYHHATDGCIMLCLKQQEKVLPSAVINEFLDDKVREIEANDGRKPGRKERSELKEEITFELLPKAFARSRRLYAYIDTRSGLLMVDSASHNRAEALLNLLRETLGSLPVIPLKAKNIAQHILTEWVRSGSPAGFAVGGECELRDRADESAVIRAKNQDLSSAQIQSHLDSGMFVSKLAVSWQESIDFVVDDQLSFKRLSFTDLVQEKADDVHTDTMAEQFDADFSIMAGEFAKFVPAVLEAFGGEEQGEAEAQPAG